MARDRKGKAKEELKGPSAPGWMITYGDMMTLLLVFFVFIVAYSTVEIEKFRAAIGSFRGALLPYAPAPTGPAFIRRPVASIAEMELFEQAEEIEAMVREAGLGELIEVHQVKGGVRIVFSDPVLFDEGKDDLKRMAFSILGKVVGVAVTLEAGEVLIEGHTDDTPIHTERFPSNWELSAARALKVLKFFQTRGFPPERLVAVGYGEYRPRAELPRTAPREEKGVNRRVEIFLKLEQEMGGISTRPISEQYEGGWGD